MGCHWPKSSYGQITTRDKTNPNNLSDPDILAKEIIEKLEHICKVLGREFADRN